MDKMTVVLDKKDINISLDGKSIRIDRPGKTVQRVPLGMIGQVIVYGNPKVECNIWRKLSEKGIPAVLLPSRGNGVPAWISPGFSTAIMVRINQFKAWSDDCTKVRAAKILLKGKIKNQYKVATASDLSISPFQDVLVKLDSADTIESLRGIEGSAAREWFGLLAKTLPKKWHFSGRNRRPPEDPVNALLSLGYTLLFSEIRRQVHLRGLDPCLGFLHSPYPGRESLVLDLAEPLRSGIDAFVLYLLEDTLIPDDFTSGKKEGCRLSKQARKLFYHSFEDWKHNWPLPGLNPCCSEENEQELKTVIKIMIGDFIRSWGIHKNEFNE